MRLAPDYPTTPAESCGNAIAYAQSDELPKTGTARSVDDGCRIEMTASR
jgi:hypothetical protein